MDQRLRNTDGPPPGVPERRSRRGTDLLLGGSLAGWAIRNVPPALVRRVVCRDDTLAALAAGGGHDVFAGDPHDPAFTPAPAALALGFPLVLRPALIERYRGAIWAIHPGLLPHGRGPHPVFWALWEGTPAGATLHEVTAAVGGGPIVEQREVAVLSSDTGGRLQERVEAAQRELFTRWLPRLAARERPAARPQPDGGTFHPLAEFEFMRDEGRYEVPRGERERLERCLAFPRSAHGDGAPTPPRRSRLARMSAIPGEPLNKKPHELTLKDGRKLKLKMPGLPPRVEPGATEERGAEEPPRDNPAARHNPNHGF